MSDGTHAIEWTIGEATMRVEAPTQAAAIEMYENISEANE